ncbi:hypothetical protein SteCoe_36515 [Stentor coeruleus]|uniref:Uncharacterized protein n=1 Tax=Stentor coeruleus TaxID=5963 RepID=A0A1R2APZ1_9CILI|nr:hypothetical protein SteCoe_36515 [Stentor coeruleus]
MASKCEYNDCKKLVEYFCECRENATFCAKHVNNHLRRPGKHFCESMLIEYQSEEERDSALKCINESMKLLKKFRSEIALLGLKIAQNVEKAMNKAVLEIALKIKHFAGMKNMILASGRIAKDDHSLLQNTSINPVANFNISHVVEKIDDFFESIIKSTAKIGEIENDFFESITKSTEMIGEIENDDKMLFWIYETSVYELDFDTLKKSKVSVSYNLSYNHSCRINEDEYFVISEGSSSCYKYNISTNSLIQEQNLTGSLSWGGVEHCNGFIYVFGGRNKVFQKYDLKKKQWFPIANTPFSNTDTKASCIEGKLCITSSSYNVLYMYDHKADQYSNIYTFQSSDINLMGRNYVIGCGKLYKHSGGDIKNWVYYNTSCPFCFCLQNSHLFFRGKYIYFLNCRAVLFRVDTENFAITNVSYS